MGHKDKYATIEQEIIGELRGEFIEDAIDRLDLIEDVLNRACAGEAGDMETLSLIRREAHSIKGMGGSFGFPIITSVAHRLEDYLSGAKGLGDQILRDSMLFVDVMREVVEDGENPDEAHSDLVLKKLPTKWALSSSSQEILDYNWEVLLCVKSAVLRTVIGKKMSAMGCRSLFAHTPFEIIQLVVTNKPDAVIMTTVMDGLWGGDVARALGAMEVTRDVPIALLTSFQDEKIGRLPEGTTLIHETPDSLKQGLGVLCDRMKRREENKVHSLAVSA